MGLCPLRFSRCLESSIIILGFSLQTSCMVFIGLPAFTSMFGSDVDCASSVVVVDAPDKVFL